MICIHFTQITYVSSPLLISHFYWKIIWNFYNEVIYVDLWHINDSSKSCLSSIFMNNCEGRKRRGRRGIGEEGEGISILPKLLQAQDWIAILPKAKVCKAVCNWLCKNIRLAFGGKMNIIPFLHRLSEYRFKWSLCQLYDVSTSNSSILFILIKESLGPYVLLAIMP